MPSTPPQTAAAAALDSEAIQSALQATLYDRGDVIQNWPDDEAAAYRDNGRFLEGVAAAQEIRFAKAAHAVLEAIQPSLEAVIASARQDALHEAADIIHARIRDREQPFTIQTQDGPVASGEGPTWAIPDLQLVEQLIRQRADPAQQASTPEGKS